MMPVCEWGTILTTKLYCFDMDTPEDPTDDTWSFAVRMFGTDLGESWYADDPLNSTGLVMPEVIFGPYLIADGSFDFRIYDATGTGCDYPDVLTANPPEPCSSGNYDLALRKVVNTAASSSPLVAGSTVVFDVIVFNQGTIAANDVTIVDYMPADLTLNDPNWTDNGDGTASYNGSLDIPPSGSQTVSVAFTIDAGATGQIDNYAEISGFGDPLNYGLVDGDSTPDTSNDDPVVDDLISSGSLDEDDHDIASITLAEFDLALQKTINVGGTDPILVPGCAVLFDIQVINQSPVDATGVVITDYIPAGLSLNDPNWTDNGNGTATYNAPISVSANMSETITIAMVVDQGATGVITNAAEISEALNINGDPVEDIDSTPDTTNGDPVVDNELNNSGGDEDDHDIAAIQVDVFDLALRKTVNTAATDMPLLVGSTVTFSIEVFNQGTVEATNVDIVDYPPNGLTLNDANWSGGSVLFYNTPLTIPAGQSQVIDITFTVDANATGVLNNYAEISDDADTFGSPVVDIDSTPDTVNSDELLDNEINNANSDEDDHDIASVSIESFDLALRKTVGSLTDNPLLPGGNVHFQIEVFNQGSIDATQIEIIDYIPQGLILADPSWTNNGNGTATYNQLLSIASGSSQVIEIDFVVDSGFTGQINNHAEISAAADDNGDPIQDLDSTPDSSNTDSLVDDEINNASGDEDDHDIATVAVAIFDLALKKVVDFSQTDQPLMPGGSVTFTITVINQGSVDATAVNIVDYIPTGLVINDPNWAFAGSGKVVYTSPLDLAAGASQDISITFNVTNNAPTNMENFAEISSAKDDAGLTAIDVDSTPDLNNNDPYVDDVTSPNPLDEDDHDIAEISLSAFDLALRKRVNTTLTDDPLVIGSTVVFDIEVFNQGYVDATDVVITDYVPTGLVLSDPNWLNSGSGTVTLNNPLSVAAGTSETVSVTFTVDAGASGVLDNYAEISEASGPSGEAVSDIDSTPDTNNNDTLVDEEIDNASGDEDDHDIASVEIIDFDLALRKTFATADSPLQVGGAVTFTITVFNQGSINARSIRLADYFPPELTLNDPNWTDAGGGIATLNSTFDLPAGGTYSVDITFQLNTGLTGPLVNYAEITDARDPGRLPIADIDSTPDMVNDDPLVDDVINYDPADEDDHDVAIVDLSSFDLALRKVVNPAATDSPLETGSNVQFVIQVFNQGTINATNIELTDYIPVGLTLNDANWTDNGNGLATYNTPISLASGASTDIIIDFIVNENATQTIANHAEISDASDADGNPINDIDSTPDTSNTDPLVDNVISDNPSDEDDHDVATISISDFDLALRKTLNTGLTDDPLAPGSAVVFDIEVFNQGSLMGTGIEITDYLPAGLNLNDATWTNNGNGTATYNAPLILAPGTSEVITIEFIVATGAAGQIDNYAEISDHRNLVGDPIADTDSTPDSNNTDMLVDDEIDPNAMDEDDHDIASVSILNYDLALRKTVNAAATDSPLLENGSVTFDIAVINQGSGLADGIVVTDYIPSGLLLNDANWTNNGDGTATYTGGPAANGGLTLNGGATNTISITFTVAAGFSGDIDNHAEISAASDSNGNPIADVDSTPDTINSDPLVDDEVDNAGGDEDDHDIATITVDEFDLALQKTINTASTDNPLQEGGDVVFNIEVFNQGTIMGTGIQITDYLPTGLTLADSGWTDNGNGTASYNTALSIAPGQSQVITVAMTADVGFTGQASNHAEISNADGPAGETVSDIDSTPDTSNTDTLVDDEINNAGGDEDDHDIATVNVGAAPIYDLALIKTLDAAGTDSPLYPGGTVTWEIRVFNQGTEDATGVQIIDYLPTGLSLNDASWTGSGTTATYNTLLSIAAGQSQVISITTVVDAGFVGTLDNYAEIIAGLDSVGAAATDVDSTPDTNNTDTLVDNEVNNAGGDEDDHDIASVTVIEEPIFDLALRKTLDAAGTSSPLYPGGTVTWDIEVFNQGTENATGVQIIDYLPTGLSLNDAAWSGSGSTATYNTLLSIPAGQSQVISIVTTVDAGFVGTLDNHAEVSAALDSGGGAVTDIDSTPDTSNTDTLVDNEINNAGGDEDDHDIASVTVIEEPIFDLALRKTLDAAGTSSPLYPGGTVTWDIEVFNQGTENATGVQIIDYLPTGLSLNDAAWSGSGSTATYNTLLSIPAGQSQVISIVTTVDAGFVGTLDNHAEVSAALDSGGGAVTDIDSTPDTSNTDTLVDNEINNAGGDEDDHDIASVTVIEEPIFDLALRKTLDAAGTSSPLYPGGTVTWDIEVFNQGTADATGVEIIDYLPTGLSLNDANWSGSGNTATYNTLLSIAAGQSQVISIVTTVDAGFVGTLDNHAEVSAALDSSGGVVTDIDSTPDTSNTDTLVDNEINNAGGDEDDHDIASVIVIEEPIFDLALRKSLNMAGTSSPLYPGGTVTWEIEVFNQGTADATGVEIIDYLPTGLSLNDANWTGSGSTATYNTPLSILAGQSQVISIVTTVDAGFEGTLDNHAEISAAFDTAGGAATDIDSTPDTSNSDVLIDDEILNAGGDEDDHDIASVTVTTEPIFDLALIKTLNLAGSDSPLYANGTATWEIRIFNQGTIDATGVEIVDYLPTGLSLNDAGWTAAGSTATYNTLLNIPVGQSETITIVTTVDAGFVGTLDNHAEISADLDGDGNPVTDVDSTPDTENLDPVVDNEVQNAGGDEDDHDIATVTVEELMIFDLALRKTLNTAGTSSPLYAGGTVTWDIEVFNQGTEDATAIEIIDYLPTGLSLNDAAWTGSGTTATYNTLLSIASGQSQVISIVTTVDAGFVGTLDNHAEISAGLDSAGGAATDVDSTPDVSNTDTLVDDEINNAGGDEDDHDIASVTVEEEPIFDLALRKTLNAGGTNSPLYAGGTVTWDIEVFNQGTEDATAIEIIDYLPTGLSLNDAAWTGSGTTATYNTLLNIAAGQSQVISIVTTVDAGFAGTLDNHAEVSAGLDSAGGAATDTDSTPDTSNTDPLVDDEINNAGGDEDDHDVASVTVEAIPPTPIFDLALRKTLNTGGTNSPLYAGGTVTWDIEVFNQGTEDATAIEIIDYLPTGLSLNDAAWTGSGTTATYNTLLNIAAGQSQVISIVTTVDAGFAGTLDNHAEVSAGLDSAGGAATDTDSTPDTSNTDPLVDDEINNAGGDEDDHDVASVTVEAIPPTPIFDLALRKTLNTGGTNSPLYAGGTVTWDIEVFNQGTEDATAIEIIDYLPTGLSLNDAAWTGSGTTATYNTLLNIAAGQSQVISIVTTVDAGFAGTLDNHAEVSAALDSNGGAATDVDSTPDTVNTDVVVDDELQNAGGDEDDHDLATVTVEVEPIFDLALRKTLNTAGTNNPLYAGGTVTWDIEVFNQGTEDATAIEIIDYLPTGLSLNDAAWTATGSTATYNTLLSIAAGQSQVISIVTIVDAGFSGTLDNHAEVSAALDSGGGAATDVDSSPDTNNTDSLVDDEINNAGGDEDDHDVESVVVEEIPPTPIFDLALRKTVNAAGTDSPLYAGGTIVYDIEVFNQGTEDATAIEITDYIPTGLVLNDAGWTLSGTSATYNTALSLPAGQSTVVTIEFTVAAGTVGTLDNHAEVSAASDSNGDPASDVDSTPDGTNNDSLVDDEILNAGGDEDDHDIESVTIGEVPPTVIDLALRKRLSGTTASPIYEGQTVTYEIEVFNQGTEDATGIQVVDYMPTGLTLSDANWTASGSTATFDTPLSIQAGQSQMITISFIVDAGTVGTISNLAEISAANDAAGNPATDADSTPDTTNDDDLVDDAIFPTSGDEDDHDIADIVVEVEPDPVIDLALRKTVDAVQSSNPILQGSTVVFAIEVFNQGSEDATGIEVTDYLPGGLSLADTDWTENANGTATYNTLLSVPAGQSLTIFVSFTVDQGTLGSVDNHAEISDALDADGNPTTDIDSTPDSTNDDPTVDDNIADIAGDEDDHDVATVVIEADPPAPLFDLALLKTVNSVMSDSPLQAGNTVVYDIEVINQGEADAFNVMLVDYLPSELILNDINWTNNGDGTATYSSGIDVAAGSSQTVQIAFEISLLASGTVENFAEIASAEDSAGANPVDNDSTPDTLNDDPVVDDVVDGTNGDEDDHDVATFVVETFDLALRKSVNSAFTDDPLLPGGDLTFNIEVFNQGDVDATNIAVIDYIPGGVELVDPNWTLDANGNASYNNLLSIAAGQSQVITISFEVENGYTGPIVNFAEISDADGPNGEPVNDEDSTPDTQNDDPVVNDEIDPNPDDEDDHDRATVNVSQFDLALQKRVNEIGTDSPLMVGATVVFEIEVYNQGILDATNISVVDYIPAGLTLNDAGWSQTGNVATYNTTLDVASGASEIITIQFTVASGAPETIVNAAEISDDAGPGGVDIIDDDSTPDDINGDAVVDDELDPDMGDEDDHDIATIAIGVFDLALIKTVASVSDTPLIPGVSTVTYEIEVINQGTIDAYNIQLADYLPAGLSLNDAGWTSMNSTANYDTLIDVPAGTSQTVTIVCDVNEGFFGDIVNSAEITAATDSGGNAVVDIDSTPDTDNTDPVIDDVVNSTNGADEDDHDIAVISTVAPTASIEIEKWTNGADADSPAGADVPVINEGGTVTWTYTVVNTGTLDLANVIVTDDLEGAVCTIALLPAGESDVCILTGTAGAGAYQNLGSVIGVPVDENGNPATGPDGSLLPPVEDEDPSNYIGVEEGVASIVIEKSTNNVDADNPNGTDVPQIMVGDQVTWEYVVTNTGTLDLVNVVVTDDQEGQICVLPSLPVGESASCNFVGVATLGDYANLATVVADPVDENGDPATDANGDPIPSPSDEDPSHYTGVDDPVAGIVVEKTTNGADADSPVGADVPVVFAGEMVTWQYTVTNTGTVDLANVTVVDDMEGQICDIALLPAGGVATCNFSGIAGVGLYANVATVTGDPIDENGDPAVDSNGDPIPDPTDEDPSHYQGEEVPQVGFDLEKFTNGADADAATDSDVPVLGIGETVTWQYVVTNSGTTDLANVTIIDDMEGQVCVIPLLPAGSNSVCELQGVADSGLYSNLATATGEPVDGNGNPATDPSGNPLPDAQDEDPSHYIGEDDAVASIVVEKSTNGVDADLASDPSIPVIMEGDEVSWTYEVTNTGNVDLANVEVIDDIEGMICTIQLLPAGMSSTCNHSDVAQLGDYVNVAVATGTPVDENGDPVLDENGNPLPEVSDDDPSHYTGVDEPVTSIDIEKYTNGFDADDVNTDIIPQIQDGGLVSWEYVVVNTGTVDLVDVQVNDDKEGLICVLASLPAGESASCNHTGVAAAGPYGNIGSVVGDPVDENGNPAVDANGDPLPSPTDEDPSNYVGTVVGIADISLEKSTNGMDADNISDSDVPLINQGGQVIWQYLVTNTGTLDLVNIEVVDDMEGPICTLPFLPAGTSSTCSYSGTAINGDYSNLGTVTGDPVDENGDPATDADGNLLPEVSDDDPSNYIGVPVQIASIDIEKSTNGADADSAFGSDVPQLMIGDQVTWEYVVTNTGSLDLANVQVVDDVEGQVCTIAFLPAGADAVCDLVGVAGNGLYENVGTATGEPVDENGDPAVDANGDPLGDVSDQDTSHYSGSDDPVASIDVEKYTNGIDADSASDPAVPQIAEGEQVTWSYVVTNNGTVDLANVTVVDDVEGAICTIPFLPAGISTTCSMIGIAGSSPYENLAIATGDPVDENGNPATDANGNPLPDPEDTDYSHYEGVPEGTASIEVEKRTNGADADFPAGLDVPAIQVGDQVTWDYFVTNTGTLDLANVEVVDNMEGAVCTIPLLAAGETASCTLNGIAGDGLYTNIATVTGDPVDENGDPAVDGSGDPIPSPEDEDPSSYIGQTDEIMNSLGDYVWYDENEDGLQGSDETGLEGITVILYTASGMPIDVTITDQDGYYIFTDLQDGSYYVHFQTPVGYELTDANMGNDEFDSDADAVDGNSDIVFLSGGQNDPSLDAGVIDEEVIISQEPVTLECNGSTSLCTEPITTLEICLDGLSADDQIMEVNVVFECSLNLDGDCVYYTPLPGFENVTETMVITVCNPITLVCQEYCYEITVGCTDPVEALDDVFTASCEDQVLDVLANDSDPAGETLSICDYDQPYNGTVILVGGQLIYSAYEEFIGYDVFNYTVCNESGEEATATVVIDVDCYEIEEPTAIDDVISTLCTEPVSIQVLSNDISPAGTALTICSVAQPLNGTTTFANGVVLYTPLYGFTGFDSFEYTICTEDGVGSTATVVVDVDCEDIEEPEAANDTAMTECGESITVQVLSNDYNPTATPLSVCSVSQPLNGTTVLSGSNVVYTPNANFSGFDSFTYELCDQDGVGSTATVTVAVDCLEPQEPLAVGDIASTNCDESVTIDVLSNDLSQSGAALSICSVGQPLNGMATQSGGTIIYTPNADFNGFDTFTYTLCSENGIGSTTSVTIAVECVEPEEPEQPVAVNDIAYANCGEPVTVSVLTNDLNPNATALTICSLGQSMNGTTTLSGNSIIYTPNPTFSGFDSFTYTLCGQNGIGSTATVTVAVDCDEPEEPEDPMAMNDIASATCSEPVTISVLANDLNPTNAALTICSVGQAFNGVASLSGSSIVYTPNADFNGFDSFTYTLCGVNGAGSTATVTVAVDCEEPQEPTALNDSASTNCGNPVTISVLSNDLNPSGINLTICAVGQTFNGTAVLSGGNVIYTPNAGFSGFDSFTYTLCGSNGNGSTATVTVAVDCVQPQEPTALNDSATTSCTNPVTVSVLSNDLNPGGANLTICSVGQAFNGSAVISGSNVIYTPNTGFSGFDTFTYTLCGTNGTGSTATVTVAVDCVGPQEPTALNDSASTNCTNPVTISVLSNDLNPGGANLTICSVGQAFNGSAVISGSNVIYTPNAGFSGFDSFTYTLCGSNGNGSTATVTVSVDCVQPQEPTALNDSASTNCTNPVTVAVLANDQNPTGMNLSICSVGTAYNGTAVISGSNVIYTPNAGFSGFDSFTYTLCGASGAGSTATVTVSVDCVAPQQPTPVNDNATTNCGNPVTIAVLANDINPGGTPLSICAVGSAYNGSAVQSGSNIIYTPNANFNGTDSFTYSICGTNGNLLTATVSVVVNCVQPTDPVPNDDFATANCQETITVQVLANDSNPSGGALAICSIGPATNGAAYLQGQAIQYTANPGFTGTDTFTYGLCGQNGATTTATVTVTVNCVQQPQNPIVSNDVAQTSCDSPVTVQVLSNDVNPTGTALNICGLGVPNNGTVSQLGTVVVYTPNNGFSGTDSFSYSACNEFGVPVNGTVTVQVASCECNNADINVCTYPMTPVLVCPEFCALDNFNIVSATTSFDCGLFILPDNCIRYTPVPSFIGTDQILVSACDNMGNCDDVLIIVEVGDCDGNTPPVATTDYASAQGGPVTISVLSNDTDEDADQLSVCGFFTAANGQVLQNGNSFIYTPNDGFYGTDYFTYTVCDGYGGEASALVEILVEAPIIIDTCIPEMHACTEVMTPIQVCVEFCDIAGPVDISNVQTLFNCSLQGLENNCFTYTPLPGFDGDEVMEVTGCNLSGQCAVTTVYMAVGNCGVGGLETDDNVLDTGKSPQVETQSAVLWAPQGLQLRNHWDNVLPDNDEWINVTLLLFDELGREVFRDENALEKVSGIEFYNYEMLAGIRNTSAYYFYTVATSKFHVEEKSGTVGVMR